MRQQSGTHTISAVQRQGKPPGVTGLFALLLLGGLLLFPALAANVNAQQQARDSQRQLLLLLSADSSIFREFESSLRDYFAEQNPPGYLIHSIVLHENITVSDIQPWLDASDKVVAAGSRSTRLLSQTQPRVPTLAALLSEEAYSRYRQQAPDAHWPAAIVLDQPYARQFTAIKRLFPQVRRIGLISSAQTQRKLAEISRAAQTSDLVIVTEDYESRLPGVIERLARLSDMILALPDSTVYNPETARTVLLASYYHNTPIVAYSSSFVRAGALAGIYSTPRDIARQVQEIINSNNKLTTGTMISPRYFTVEINPSVAQSLGITVPDQKTINDILHSEGSAP